MKRKWPLISGLVLLAVAAASFALLSPKRLEPVNTASARFEPRQIERGEYLARVGDCTACHTAPGGAAFAGGLVMQTPIGAIYSTNITPDPETGIGDYSFEAFERALRHGIAREGHTLYPAMPYPSYARVSESNLRDLYAYFMRGVAPVRQANRDSDIPWPLSMRWPLSIWRGLFAPKAADFVPRPGQDAVVARGAYLVEGLGHCGACHTPRALTMQEKALTSADGARYLSGSVPLESWVAKSLRGDHRTGIGSWSEAELAQFLRTGRNEHNAVFGSMTGVVEHSLQYLDAGDATAIARYLKTLPANDPGDAPFRYDGQVGHALWQGDDGRRGAAVYIDNCAACHRTDGRGYATVFPALAGSATLNSDDPTSLIHIVLRGGTLPATRHAPSTITMPGFGWRLDDRQIADVVTFIRGSWGNGGHPVAEDAVRKVRRATANAASEDVAAGSGRRLIPPGRNRGADCSICPPERRTCSRNPCRLRNGNR
ncbi:MAG: cytochrome c [Xanthomonadaceae bacterium]|nr:cytochrome c [Xanthomonadaceae bacterium]